MSGVPESKRKEAKTTQFMTIAQQLWDEVERLEGAVIEEPGKPKRHIIPKAKKFTLGVPMVQTARSCVYNINAADKFYPNTAINVLKRKEYLGLALADATQLFLDLQHAKRVGLNIPPARMQNLLDLAEEETRKLKAARNGVKLIGSNQSIEDQIATKEEELNALRILQKEKELDALRALQ